MEYGSYEGYFNAVGLPNLLKHYTLCDSNLLPWRVYRDKDFTLYRANKCSFKTGNKQIHPKYFKNIVKLMTTLLNTVPIKLPIMNVKLCT